MERRPRLAVGASLFAVIAFLLGPTLARGRMLVLDDGFTSDLWNSNVPPRAFLGEALRAGRFPLWYPGIFGGMPLVPQGEAAATNPITWLLYGAFDWVTATTLSVALHGWLGGLGAGLLALRLGVRAPAAVVAALAFMLCGPLVGHVKHMNLHHASIWLPWLLLCTDRMREAPGARSSLALGVVVALGLTEGHPQMSHIALCAAVPWGLLRLLSEPPRPSLRHVVAIFVSLVTAAMVAFALAGAYALAGSELAGLSERAAPGVDKWAYATRFPFFAATLLTLVVPYVHGDASTDSVAHDLGVFWEFWLYTGLLPFVLALGAVALGWLARRGRSRLVYALVALAALSLSMMFGAASPVYRWAFATLPGVSWFRFPQRFGLVLSLVIALLAALGLDSALAQVRRWLGRRAGVLVGFVAIGATAGDLVWVMQRQFPSVPGTSITKPPPTVAALREAATPGTWRVFSAFAPAAHLEAARRARGWSRKLGAYVGNRALLQPSSNVQFGIETIHGYTSLAPYDSSVVLGTHTVPGILDSGLTHSALPASDCGRVEYHGPCAGRLRCSDAFARMLGAYNVRFLLSPLALLDCAGFDPVAVVPSGMFMVWIYENRLAMPRAYVVGQVKDVTSAEAAGRAMLGELYEPSRTAFRTVPRGEVVPLLRRRPAGVREVLGCDYKARWPGEAIVSCSLDAPGYLVIADARYPGQEVTVDGKLTVPFTANGFLIGVPLGAGRHEIIVRFRPKYVGLLVTAAAAWATLALCAASVLVSRVVRSARAHRATMHR